MKELPTEKKRMALSLNRVPFLDNFCYLMILLVLVYHACGANASVAPHRVVHDTTSLIAGIIRELFDVFMMPLLFFPPDFLHRFLGREKGPGDFSRKRSNGYWFPGPWPSVLN